MYVKKIISPKYLSRILKILNFKYLLHTNVKVFQLVRSIITNKYIEDNGYTLSNYGVWMLNNPYDKTFRLSIMGYRNGLEKILLSINEPMIFIDIGANQGVFSLVASKNVNFVQIHAFEPNLNLISFLENNFIRNQINNFLIHAVAIGPQSKSVNFYVPENHSGNGRVSVENSNMKVDCVNRIYLNKNFILSTESYFIKIDTEGSEAVILDELFNSNINMMIKYIFIEINNNFSNETILIKKLKSYGFYQKSKKGNSVSYDALFVR